MKKDKIREHISCILYLIAFFGFLGAVTVENKGSLLDFSDLARAVMCAFSAICVIIAAIVWKAKDERGKKIKYGIMVVAIVAIIGGGINSEIFKEPPELIVVCGEEQITALKGTYSWEYSNGNGTSVGVEADSMHPLECKEYMTELPIVYSYKSSVDSFKAYLQFEVVPDEVTIRYWDEGCWNDYAAESTELEVQAVEVDFVDGRFTTDYAVKLLEGNYIYEVVAKWNSSENYNGTAHYSFYTVMGSYETVPVQE